MRFIIVTGLSGAGKSQAMHCMEDMGFFCIDNLPPKLMPKFAELCYQSGSRIDKIAVVVDIRGGEFFDDLFECLEIMRDTGYTYEIIYLEASDNVLIRRFKETRRTHPLVRDGRITEGIQEERERLKDLKDIANHIIDTSNLQSKQLRELIYELITDKKNSDGMIIQIISFGFKHGVLLDADLVFDVRFLPNPFYIEHLKKHSGKEKEVKDYLFMFPETQIFLDKLEDMLEFLIPYYKKEGKSQLFIGIGCTGGVHRSVTIVDALCDNLRSKGHHAVISHRDINRES